MNRAWRSTLVALGMAALAVLAPAAGNSATHRGGSAHASVIGGRTAPIEAYPWLAYIESEEGRGTGFVISCTGSVVAPRLVLTAGHCVDDPESESLRPASSYVVATGVASHLHVPHRHLSRVTRALIFPGFDAGSGESVPHGDAGLLVLSKPTSAPPLPLAGAVDEPLLSHGTPVEVAGWGITDVKRDLSPALFRTAKIVVQDQGLCRTRTARFNPGYSPAVQMCTLDPPEGPAASGCFGDSGGPLVGHRGDGSAVEVGIVSGGDPECTPRLPNIFTRVDRVSSWVSEWIAAVELGAPAPALKVFAPPLMLGPEADFLARRGLAEDFTHGNRVDFVESVSLRCARTKRAQFRCRAHWSRGGAFYAGTISVSFLPHTGPLTWNDRYTIHRVGKRCLRTAAVAGRCPVHTRTRHDGPPKRI